MEWLFVFACLFATPIFASSAVPVVIWSDGSLPPLKPALAGHTLTTTEFESKYLDATFHSKSQNIIVFIQSQLSLEDFTRYGNVYDDSKSNVFKNVKEYMRQPSSLSLHAVENPTKNLKSWTDNFDGNVVNVDSASVDSMKIDGDRNVVLVELPKDIVGYSEMLETNDKIIQKVVSKVKNYIALYTALEPSQVYTPLENAHPGRRLLAVGDGMNYTLINMTDCPMTFMTEVKLMYMKMDNTKKVTNNCTFILPHIGNDGATNCLNNSGKGWNGVKNQTMDLMFVGEDVNLTIKWMFGVYAQIWNASIMITVQGKCGNEQLNDEVMMLQTPFEAPVDFSYHCAKPNPIMSNYNLTKTENRKYALHLKDLQIQPFFVKNYKFGRPGDCEGFFTIPIWMGLTSMLILLSVVLFGIAMLSSIQSNDQFDDPKGKTITVNVNE